VQDAAFPCNTYENASAVDRVVMANTDPLRHPTYSEPATLWRLVHADGDVARATIIPGTPRSTLCFFVNDRLERGENFDEWDRALERAERVRLGMLEEGWRVADE
jgi:hypothetical protein